MRNRTLKYCLIVALALCAGCSYSRVRYDEIGTDGTRIVTDITNVVPPFGRAASEGKAAINAKSTAKNTSDEWGINIGDVRDTDNTGQAAMLDTLLRLAKENAALKSAAAAGAVP